MYLSLEGLACLFLASSVVVNQFLDHSCLNNISIELDALGVDFRLEFVEQNTFALLAHYKYKYTEKYINISGFVIIINLVCFEKYMVS